MPPTNWIIDVCLADHMVKEREAVAFNGAGPTDHLKAVALETANPSEAYTQKLSNPTGPALKLIKHSLYP